MAAPHSIEACDYRFIKQLIKKITDGVSKYSQKYYHKAENERRVQ